MIPVRASTIVVNQKGAWDYYYLMEPVVVAAPAPMACSGMLHKIFVLRVKYVKSVEPMNSGTIACRRANQPVRINRMITQFALRNV